LFERREIVARFGGYGSRATLTARLRLIASLSRLGFLAFGLILALPLLCQLQLAFELFDAAALGCFLGRTCSGDITDLGVGGLVLA
jgi:hypothetical protein